MPEISVLMPVFNAEKYLREALDSILQQTYQDFEFVIVDDGSTDSSPEILLRYAARDNRIHLITLPDNQGIQKALNCGLNQCQGYLVARQDADDVSTVTRLAVEKQFIDNRPGTAMVGTGMYVIDEVGKLLMIINDRPCSYPVVREFLKEGCPFVHGSVMFRRWAVKDLGGYSEDQKVKHAEDYDLWVRLAKDHVVENIPDCCLYFHRNHGTKISSVHREEQEAATKYIQDIARKTL